MPIAVHYPHDPRTAAPRHLDAAAIRRLALQVRRQIGVPADAPAIALDDLIREGASVVINDRQVAVVWDLAHPVHDESGAPVLGLCDVDPDEPDCALVSINGTITKGRADLALSTAAHEFGHVIFDVPSALACNSTYRGVARDAASLHRVGRGAEARANEFMGALLAPPVTLHTRLLAHARTEGLRLARGPHHGRPGSPILAADNPADVVSGVMAALAGDFGVSERFVAVRLARYGLVQGGVA
jgi:Zn-dependent peptidase ImmA (M78 family)